MFYRAFANIMRQGMINIYAWDIETNPKTFKFVVSCLYGVDGKVQETFYSVEKAVNYFFKYLSNNRNTVIYSHYGGGFDFNYILDYCKEAGGIKIKKFLEVGGRIFLLHLDRNGLEIIFRDSYALLSSSLDKAANDLLDESKVEIDFDNFESYSSAELEHRCMEDCRLLHDCLKVFREEIGADLKLTMAQQALNDFEKNHLGHRLPMQTKGSLDYFRQYYFGGHVDVYKRYAENVIAYDIVSAYGSAMKEFGAPVGFPRLVSRATEGKAGFYQVLIKNMNFKIPPFARRLTVNKTEKLYFLNSDQPFNLTSHDLYLLNHYNIDYKVLNGIEFDHDPEFFAGYIDKWHGRRFEGTKLEFISKKFVNGLYGKFGQKYSRLSTKLIKDVKKEVEEGTYFYDKDMKLARKQSYNISWFMQYHIAAWITSGARNLLHYYQLKYQDNLCYSDTDSIFLSDDYKICENDLTEKKELGKLDVQGKYDRAYFISPKFYTLINKEKTITKLKGFESKDLDEKFFRSAINGRLGDYHYHNRKLAKFKTALISASTFLHIQETKKKIEQISMKRKLSKNGIDTEPFFWNGKKLT